MLLSDIRLIEATSYDFAKALNSAMNRSKVTAKVLTNQLNIKRGYISHRDIEKMYPPDTFSPSNGKINKSFALDLCKEIQKIFRQNTDVKSVSMLDFSRGFIKIIEKAQK